MDTMGSVAQIKRMVDAGCEYVRITAPSVKEAENLGEIKKVLRAEGYTVPLIADIHFTPNAAELAARLVEKVRINPGNYADKKKFETIEYTDTSYQAELDRIREKFVPLVSICKEYGTAMRIGTNHGSLSDRILSRYGDTPLGMVESALEFLRICEDLKYYNIVLSMKASNTRVMVQAYRLLVQKLQEEGLQPYPLHLGVTEAGEAEDGRIKSAVGIGTLLEDGLGDTVRVSLTEAPEFEVPVAKKLIDRYTTRKAKPPIPSFDTQFLHPFEYHKRESIEVGTIGGSQVPRVLADFSSMGEINMSDLKSIGHFYLPELDKWSMNDIGADYIYSGKQKINFMLPNGLKEIVDADLWKTIPDITHVFPMFLARWYKTDIVKHPKLNFIQAYTEDIDADLVRVLQQDSTAVLVLETVNEHALADVRSASVRLTAAGCTTPIIIKRSYSHLDDETLVLYASTDIGGLLVDGIGDGVLLSMDKYVPNETKERLTYSKVLNGLGFGILQAARTRMTKTEYISCPSCGRTLFDLQETTAMIRSRTDHLKGVKIGIMGCIVNGPGEMADADYGYVGVGKDKIALYRGQEVVKKAVPSDKAVDELIELIREDGKWLEPVSIEQMN
jgi:(E)-4-hydroxy-3-methylbut-2-enyl-diphosphate synthase